MYFKFKSLIIRDNIIIRVLKVFFRKAQLKYTRPEKKGNYIRTE